MKAGILTYHRARNFGAVLQAYALQTLINSKNIDCELIDYKCEQIEKAYEIIKINNIKNFIKYMINIKFQRNSKLKYDNFNNKYQRISTRMYSKETINESNSIYDHFIVGSDQVWNSKLNGNDDIFLLNFVMDDNKKNSYAASIGKNNMSDSDEEYLKKSLMSFNNISLREQQHKDYIEKLSGRNISIVLDPTLLIKKENWDKLIGSKIMKKEYILIYIVAPSDRTIKLAKKLSKVYNYEVICLHNSFKRIPGIKNITDASPEEFLNYIKYAKLIITTSFHGICFSINYEKNFFYELDNNSINNNSRIESLVGMFNLKNRQIFSDDITTTNNVDYKAINKILDDKRKESLSFIDKIFKESV